MPQPQYDPNSGVGLGQMAPPGYGPLWLDPPREPVAPHFPLGFWPLYLFKVWPDGKLPDPLGGLTGQMQTEFQEDYADKLGPTAPNPDLASGAVARPVPPYPEGHNEGRDQGRDQGRNQGRAAAHQQEAQNRTEAQRQAAAHDAEQRRQAAEHDAGNERQGKRKD
jgi:hypothetical protein